MVYCSVCAAGAGRPATPALSPGPERLPLTMTRYCLIVLQTPLVAQDLALTLQDLTGTTPLLAGSLAEAFETLTATADGPAMPPGALACALLHTDSAGLMADPLLPRLADLGAPIVLVGHAAELEVARGEGHPDWPVLAQPFGPAQVAEVLQRAGALPGPRGHMGGASVAVPRPAPNILPGAGPVPVRHPRKAATP